MVPGIFAWRLYNMNTCTFHFDFIFAQKCSTQNVKVIPYISLYLYIYISLCMSVLAHYLCIPSLLSKGHITQGFC